MTEDMSSPFFAIQVPIVRTPQLSIIPSNDINLTPGLTYRLSVFWWLPSQTPAVLAMISPWGAGTSVSVSRHAYQRTIGSHCVVCFVSFCCIFNVAPRGRCGIWNGCRLHAGCELESFCYIFSKYPFHAKAMDSPRLWPEFFLFTFLAEKYPWFHAVSLLARQTSFRRHQVV